MKNNIILTFTLFFCIAIAATAQIKSDSQAIAAIDKAAAKLNTAYGTTVKMSIKEPDKDKATTENMDIKLSGNKFYLKTKDMEVFFDGKTQWVVFPELNEVSISNPTAKELQEISPVAIIKNYKNRCYKPISEQQKRRYFPNPYICKQDYTRTDKNRVCQQKRAENNIRTWQLQTSDGQCNNIYFQCQELPQNNGQRPKITYYHSDSCSIQTDKQLYIPQ